MKRSDPLHSVQVWDRRTFLKSCGALGLGVLAGGLLQGTFKIVDLGDGLESVSLSRIAMGTTVTITAVHSSRTRAQEAIGRAFEEIDRLVPLLSRHDFASPLFVLNRDGVLNGAPPELLAVIDDAIAQHRVTGGLFDITVKPVLDLLESSRHRPSSHEISAAFAHVGIGNVQRTERGLRLRETGMGITLDGIAKGTIIDRASETLTRHGIVDHLVNGGGDIRTSGRNSVGRPWTIAIEDPRKRHRYPQILHLTSAAIATSGRYEIFFDKAGTLHHIIDPRSGACPLRTVSATVLARTVQQADALSTAAMIANSEDVVKMIGRVQGSEAFLIDQAGQHFQTQGWERVAGKPII